MKKKIIITVSVILVAVALILFFPIPRGSLDDGGSRVYDALTYKLVVWNRLYLEAGEKGEVETKTFRKVSLFWYPESKKSIDELYRLAK